MNRLHPGEKTLLQLLGGKGGEDPRERVVEGRAVRQLQKAAKPGRLGLGKGRNRQPAIGAADDPAQRHHQDVGEPVVLVPRLSRVGHAGEVRLNAQLLLAHRQHPQLAGCWRHPT